MIWLHDTGTASLSVLDDLKILVALQMPVNGEPSFVAVYLSYLRLLTILSSQCGTSLRCRPSHYISNLQGEELSDVLCQTAGAIRVEGRYNIGALIDNFVPLLLWIHPLSVRCSSSHPYNSSPLILRTHLLALLAQATLSLPHIFKREGHCSHLPPFLFQLLALSLKNGHYFIR